MKSIHTIQLDREDFKRLRAGAVIELRDNLLLAYDRVRKPVETNGHDTAEPQEAVQPIPIPKSRKLIAIKDGKWRCPVCREDFDDMYSARGHMGTHRRQA
jgi:hypothetical protein